MRAISFGRVRPEQSNRLGEAAGGIGWYPHC